MSKSSTRKQALHQECLASMVKEVRVRKTKQDSGALSLLKILWRLHGDMSSKSHPGVFKADALLTISRCIAITKIHN